MNTFLLNPHSYNNSINTFTALILNLSQCGILYHIYISLTIKKIKHPVVS